MGGDALDCVFYEFGNYFIANIVERDSSKTIKGDGPFLFWNERKEI